MGVETTSRSQKIRLAAAKTRKLILASFSHNSELSLLFSQEYKQLRERLPNLVFFAKVRKIMDYYFQKTIGYLKGYQSLRITAVDSLEVQF